MNKRQIAIANAILGASEFSKHRISDFTHDPSTKVDLKFAAARALLVDAVTRLGGAQAIQSGRVYHLQTARQADLREALEEELSDIQDTVAAIAAETGDPSLKVRFRMPDGRGDHALAAAALGMAAAIRDLGLHDEFESHGFPADTTIHLETLVGEFLDSEGQQGASLGDRAGSTAAIPGILTSGRTGIRILTSIFNRVYKDRGDLLAGWETASRIERVYTRTPRPAPSAPGQP